MITLGLDTSAVAASAALWEDGRLLGENFINVKLTHSQTILPMVESLFSATGKSVAEVDRFAVSTGPGSFTGLRIGISAVKGLAFGTGKECVSVSTLQALAYNLLGQRCIAACAMDARVGQVYCAIFRIDGDTVERLCEDAAMSAGEFQEKLMAVDSDLPRILVGDGAQLCYNSWKGSGVSLAPPHLRYQKAASVCMAAEKEGQVLSAEALHPSYLRLPQAERELLQKQQKA